ncbi:NAD(P)-binding protein [Mycobacterium interjectum]|uniref:NAD(P)-binding protein n=1 Tax=Mycobacterium interjectum TaxID=33895 RepID=UPI001B3C9DA1|nr:NAD(P)-binding protein [Mycobacterium interjectum]
MTQVLQETTRKGVGSQRWQRPLYVDLLPPCNHACPAGENIQAWLTHAQAGEYERAWQALVADNPLPSTHGRACYHPCEGGCNRASLDSSVAIHAVERFLGDLAVEEGWRVPVAPPSGKKVLVVGAGPGGLSCAYHLARLGYQVEIRDGATEPGGMMEFGIPAYRLPREALRNEITRITAMPGITLKCGQRVNNVLAEKHNGGFDAVFVAVGAHEANHVNIPAMDGKKIIDAVSLLGEVKEGKRPKLGRAVAIIGGGGTAVDAARTARRLGADDALIVYRRDKAHLRATPSEAAEAFAEGVKIKWLSTVEQFGADGIVIEKVDTNPDGSVTPTGNTERLAADSVVLAVGQHSDLSLLRDAADVKIMPTDIVQVDEVLMTGHPGIFAGGDCIGGARTMTTAVGHGKLAARAMDAWMRGESYQHPASHPLVTFDMLHLLDYLDAPRSQQREVPPAQRSGFGEVAAGLDEKQARYEAQRCLSCGNCFECDNCYAACPEQAITRLGPGQGYSVDMDLCTGCATCFEQCPCHAIEMAPEPPGQSLTVGNLGEPLAPNSFKVRT